MHCYTQNIKALGLMVLEKKTFVWVFFPIVRIWKLMPPGVGPLLTTGA